MGGQLPGAICGVFVPARSKSSKDLIELRFWEAGLIWTMSSNMVEMTAVLFAVCPKPHLGIPPAFCLCDERYP